MLAEGASTSSRSSISGADPAGPDSPLSIIAQGISPSSSSGAKMICRQRYLEFGCEGQAGRIKPLPLETVAHRYTTGELSQHVH
jgi:hypothetical protein